MLGTNHRESLNNIFIRSRNNDISVELQNKKKHKDNGHINFKCAVNIKMPV